MLPWFISSDPLFKPWLTIKADSMSWLLNACLCFSLILAWGTSAVANEQNQTLQVMVSMPPLKFIAEDLVGEHADVRMISQNGSPHHKVLRPSDIQLVLEADLILWVGGELEQYLVRFVNRSQAKSLTLIEHTSEQRHRHADDDHSGADDHSHHDHANGVDPHLWMSPTAVQEYVQVVRDHLEALDPINAGIYQHNAARLITAITSKRQEWQAQAAKYADRAYFVYHDAYGYLEQELAIESMAVLTVNPGVKPSAKKLGQLSRQLSGVDRACVFYEPEFHQVKLDRVTSATLHYQLLDPLGSQLSLSGSDELQYIEFINRLVGDMTGCLSLL